MYYETEIERDAESVLEAVFEKRSLDRMMSALLKQLDKKLKTEEDCDTYLEKIKVDAAKFNDNLKILQNAKDRYEKKQIDYTEFKATTRKASHEIASCCRTFKIKLSSFGGINATSNITKEDIVNFKAYLAGIIKGVNSIKKQRKMTRKSNMKHVTESIESHNNMQAYQQAFNQALSDLESLLN